MYCIKCGAQIPEGGKFCVRCGSPVGGVAPGPMYPQPYGQAADEPVRFFSFGESVKNFFKGYVDFKGRATRAEFWWAFLFNFIIGLAITLIAVPFIVFDMLGGILSFNPTYFDLFPYIWPMYIYSLAVLLPSLALHWRRLHDTGKSGLFFLLYFIPFAGFIIMLVFCCQESDADNRFGPRKTERRS